MCEFTQREYSCGHFRFIAARWCNLYKISHRRCHPDVTHFEFRQHEICGICQPYEMPAWFHSVKVRSAPAPASAAPSLSLPPSLSRSPSSVSETPAKGPPSSCVRKRRSSTKKAGISMSTTGMPSAGLSSSTAMSPKKAKPSRPPIPLFSSTPALASHRAA